MYSQVETIFWGALQTAPAAEYLNSAMALRYSVLDISELSAPSRQSRTNAVYPLRGVVSTVFCGIRGTVLSVPKSGTERTVPLMPSDALCRSAGTDIIIRLKGAQNEGYIYVSQ